jgi:MtaA/CmuA family methyltransferase
VAKEMLISALRGKQTPKAPWVPYAGVHCAYRISEPADKYLQDPQILARGLVETAKLYKADGIPLVFDLSVEAEALGVEIKYWKDNVPSIRSHPLSGKTLGETSLKMLSAKDGRWPVIIEAAKIAKPQLDQLDCALMGLSCGPLTLASHLVGVRFFTDVYKNKDKAHAVLKYCAEILRKSTSIYCEIGCEIVAIVDPVASQIQDEVFKEFVHPYCQDAISLIHEEGKTSSFFICGDATKVLDSVCQLGTHSFAIDEHLNLNFVRDLARKYGLGFCGNLKLTLAMSLGLISPREDALINLAAGGTEGYVFAPG